MLRSAGGLVRDVGRLLRDGVDPAGGDARLLHRFVVDRDPAAFEAIVDRHGPPVLAVCRRYLKDPADVEDAFQATFLVLVRKASGLRDGDALSSWLYGVAYRVAVRARSDALRRRAREGEREGLQDAPAEPLRPVDDALEVLDSELSRLPDKYRTPLVLCYLEGRTHDQAATELGWPVGTVRSRMAKGRSLLRERLTRRGVDAPACLAALRAEVAAIPTVPSSLVAATASAAVRFAGLSAGLAWLGASPSSSTWPAARLALGVLATMSTTPWKLIGLTLACAGITAASLAAGAREAPGGPQDPPRPEASPAAEPPLPESTPTGVVGRLSEVERKLDRMMGLLESLAAKPASPAAASADSTSTAASATRPPLPAAPPSFDTRSLREIEAQLVSLERKFRLSERNISGLKGVVSTIEVETTREDAVAPARLLVARLREMQDEAADDIEKINEEFGPDAAQMEDLDRRCTQANERYWKAEQALLKAGGDPTQLNEYLGPNPPGSPSPEIVRLAKVAIESMKTAGRLGDIRDRAAEKRDSANPARRERALESIHRRIQEIERLIAWARSHFPDVELTTAPVPAS
ncbi:MAG: hypothetical protein BGO49_14060 [Planctomycetales bacterium 71-10]|nr:MAG: hypothetical protein BGO49_14060 [Planctomycetales bacterium 71-10]